MQARRGDVDAAYNMYINTIAWRREKKVSVHAANPNTASSVPVSHSPSLSDLEVAQCSTSRRCHLVVAYREQVSRVMAGLSRCYPHVSIGAHAAGPCVRFDRHGRPITFERIGRLHCSAFWKLATDDLVVETHLWYLEGLFQRYASHHHFAA